MTARGSGMEEYVAFVSELYKMPFSISDMPEKKKQYHRKKGLEKKGASEMMFSDGSFINYGSGNSGHQGMPSVLTFQDS
nr:hypothetical protein [uncultured Eisenbergiella sp.]